MQGFTDVLVDGIIRLVLSDSVGQDDKCVYLSHPNYIYTVRNRSELPNCSIDHSRLVVVSDTHDRHHRIGTLPDCDLLIHCGDIMMTSRHFSLKNCIQKMCSFNNWLLSCSAKQRIVLGGNHDHFLERIGAERVQELLPSAVYLENSPYQYEGVSIWGTPLSNGKSPNRAFQSPDFLKRTQEQKPKEVDILITHGLCEEITSTIDHKLHIWGHSHNSYGIRYPGDYVKVHSKLHPVHALSVCAPIMNGRFKPRNLPVVIDIPKDTRKLNDIPNACDMVSHKYSARSGKFSKSKSQRYNATEIEAVDKPNTNKDNGPTTSPSPNAELLVLSVADKPVNTGSTATYFSLWNNRVVPE